MKCEEQSRLLTPPPFRLVTATCTNNVELTNTSPVFDRSRTCRNPTDPHTQFLLTRGTASPAL